jgi:hypothetical protein
MRALDPRGMTHVLSACVRPDASITQIWWINGSRQTRWFGWGRITREDAIDAPIRSDKFGRSRMVCIGILEMP